MRQVLGAGALGRPRGMRWGGRREGGLGWGTHVNPWLIHVNVWQKPLQYYKVISLQLIKINGNNNNNKVSPVYNRSHSGWGPHLLGEYFAGNFWGLLLLHPSVHSFAVSCLHSAQLFFKTLLFQFRLCGIFVFPSCMQTELVALKLCCRFFFFPCCGFSREVMWKFIKWTL